MARLQKFLLQLTLWERANHSQIDSHLFLAISIICNWVLYRMEVVNNCSSTIDHQEALTKNSSFLHNDSDSKLIICQKEDVLNQISVVTFAISVWKSKYCWAGPIYNLTYCGLWIALQGNIHSIIISYFRYMYSYLSQPHWYFGRSVLLKQDILTTLSTLHPFPRALQVLGLSLS